ncbi:efflux pump antibiotic resistance [Colletotrichum truncatum]|uniref:Efflux pump antibiotic resistance n=1 Tax=Colletotrichum truncatum TaxID=5467 RepID=A0ACC3Z8N5_COLTU|nr:efflux pump antibiotic resistance [Colletotrichum truncatum]KAF6789248.1 efflux pump antibiotic resistance [Colletotrichum truncatum]
MAREPKIEPDPDGDIELSSSQAGSVLPETKEENSAISAAKHPREGWSAWRWPCIQVLFCLTGLLLGYDVSNTANIQAPIYEAFGQVHLLSWVAVGYTAMNVTVIPLVRKIAFLGNLRWQVVGYCCLFFIGSVVSGAAPNLNAVIIGRALQGIGAAGLYQLALTINIMIATPAELPRVQGLVAVAWATGLILGPFIGGAFAENHNATWRWAMYINLPVLAIIMFASTIAVPNLHVPNSTSVIKGLLAVDWVGVVLHMSGFILFCSALIFSGSTWAWSSSSAIVAWVFVGVIYVVYILQQKFCLFTNREHRNISADLLKNRTVLLVCLATYGVGSSYGVTLYYTPLYFAFTKGYDPVDAAVRLLPFIFTFIFFAIVSAGAMPVIGIYAPFYVAGGLLTTIGGALQAQITVSTAESRIMGVTTLIGAGLGCMWQTGIVVIVQHVPSIRRVDATALFILFQLAGISITLAMAGCIFQNIGFSRVQESLQGLGFSDRDIREALAGLDSKIWVEADPQVIKVTVGHVADVIAKNHYLIVAAGVISFLSGCLMKWEKLDFGRKSSNKASNP